ncbi:MAG: hypothetical protein OXB86_05450 [Bdellovibrionales bacterium]|nr:hypothetical protein [Bdellovibrionales bacterium]
MNVFPYYLTEVLGVKNYLCPRETYATRKLIGSWPCDTLVLTEGAPPKEALQLLKKIMGAIEVSDFSLMEIKDLSCFSEIKDFLLEKQVKKVLIFSTKLSTQFTDSKTVLTSCNLEELLTGPSSKDKKLELWNRLKKWKQ